MGKKAICHKCNIEFKPTKKQVFNLRHGKKIFCSRECYLLSRGFVLGGKKSYGVCKTCGEDFVSKHGNKIFCSLACYLKDPTAIERLRNQAVKANRARLKNLGITDYGYTAIKCAHCGKEKTIKKSTKGKRNFCNSLCYRRYMAGRFDRWIADPQTIALPQNYDEFLTQETLPCPIEGCGWEGSFLSAHANLEHGIPAEEFKQMVGFNLTTGVVSPELSDKMRQSAINRGCNGLIPGSSPWNVRSEKYISLEASEHRKKARALSSAIKTNKFKPCLFCGEPVEQNYCGHTLYCSTKCRSAYYAKRERCHELMCFICGKVFMGSKFQSKRNAAGKKVYCSIHCRNKANANTKTVNKRREL